MYDDHVLKIFLVQETNEKSFKLLQDYIANANADARDRGGYGGPYDFEFYSNSTGDEKIQLTLPAPVRDGWVLYDSFWSMMILYLYGI